MKTAKKIIALALVAAIMCLALASCGKTLSGTYSSSLGTTLKFSGNKVTFIKFLGVETSVEAKYEIADGKITFTFDGENAPAGFSGALPFEQDGKTIKIGIITYTKQ